MNRTPILQEATRKLIRVVCCAAVSLAFVVGSTGCGRKGALTLPKQPATQQTQADLLSVYA